jgi:hypothetical protein
VFANTVEDESHAVRDLKFLTTMEIIFEKPSLCLSIKLISLIVSKREFLEESETLA